MPWPWEMSLLGLFGTFKIVIVIESGIDCGFDLRYRIYWCNNLKKYQALLVIENSRNFPVLPVRMVDILD